MRTHRVLMSELREGENILSGTEALHLSRVLRVKEGQPIVAFDGAGAEASGRIETVEDGRVIAVLEAARRSEVEPALGVTLAVALLKGDKLSDVVRQGTELGVRRFRPVITRHSDVRLLAPARLERLRRVAREASKQCGRSVVPVVDDAVSLRNLSVEGTVLYAHPGAQATIADLPAASSVTVITGPEGGLAAEELAELDAAGATGIQLGRRILRAETAPVAIAAALLVARGD